MSTTKGILKGNQLDPYDEPEDAERTAQMAREEDPDSLEPGPRPKVTYKAKYLRVDSKGRPLPVKS